MTCKWDIKYAHLLTTDHMGNTCALYHYQRTKFCHCRPLQNSGYLHFLFLPIRKNMPMRYLKCASTTTEHKGNTWVHYYPHTKFCHCSPYRTLDICHFCYWLIWTNMQMRYFLKYAHSVTTDHVGNTCAYHYSHTNFYENQSLGSH